MPFSQLAVSSTHTILLGGKRKVDWTVGARWGDPYVTGDNLKLVWAECSPLS